MKKYRQYFLLFLILFGTKVQAVDIDSLKQELSQASGLEKLNILNQLSNHYAATDPRLSLSYDSLALDIAVAEDDLNAQSNILNNMGLSFYAISDVAKAIVLISQSLELKEQIADTLEIDKTLNNLGVLYQLIGDYDAAIRLLSRSLDIRRQQNDSSGIARTLSNASVILNRAGRSEQALLMLEEAQAIYTKLNDLSGLASVYNNIGTIYQRTGDNRLAKEFLLQSLEMKCEEDDPRFTANTYNNLGMTSMALGDYVAASAYYQKALDLRTRINDIFGLATVNVNMGELYRITSEYSKSEQHLLDALKIAEREQFKEPLQRSLYQLSQLYAAMGRFEAAYDFAYRALAAQEALYDDELSKQITNMEMQLKTEITHRENEMLRLDNRLKEMAIRRSQSILYTSIAFSVLILLVGVIIWIRLVEKRKLNNQLRNTVSLLQQSEKSLKKANAEKDNFFSIIAHDLTSPFNSILGFSDLLLSSYDDYSDKEKKKFIGNIREASSETYSLLQSLLEYGRSQTGKMPFEPEHFDLKELVEAQKDVLMDIATKKSIAVETDFPENTMVYADKNMVLSVLSKLISNAVKFSQRGSKVRLSARPQNYQLLIEVSDQGIGIPAAWQKDLFAINKEHKRKGTENERGGGFGLVLCAELVKKNEGNIWVESTENQGSSFFFTLIRNPKTDDR